jgi:DNA-binding NtrC family response regulator
LNEGEKTCSQGIQAYGLVKAPYLITSKPLRWEKQMELRILIVDDDLPVLKALMRSLSLNYDLVQADSGQQALDILQQDGPFDVIMSDLRMRHMDGVEFLIRAKKVSPESYIIILTGNQDQSAVEYVRNSGVVDCMLQKPSTKDDIVLAIEQGRLKLQKKSPRSGDVTCGASND